MELVADASRFCYARSRTADNVMAAQAAIHGCVQDVFWIGLGWIPAFAGMTFSLVFFDLLVILG